MRQAQTYKPSNTFSFVGFILMFVSMLLAGCLLSWLYVVLQAVIPIIYLCVLITIGFGAAIGGIGALFVKIYKIRYPMLAILAALIAMLFVYLFHWCIYVDKDYKDHYYDYLKKTDASSFFIGINENEIDEDVAAYIASTRDGNVSAWRGDEGTKLLGLENGLDDVLGSNADEIKASVLATKGKNAYDFLYTYRNLPKHTVGYLLVHPGALFSDIKNINEYGRWTTRSSRSSFSSSSSKNSENVKGVFLWIVWFGELLLMFAPALAIVGARAGTPFIEQDNDWAITDKPALAFKFVDPYPGNPNGEQSFKNIFKNDIDSLFSLQPLLPKMGALNTFYSVSYCHSKFYTENYLHVTHTRVTNARNNQRAVTTVAKKVKVDADYIATLHAMFGYPVPSSCPGKNMFANQQTQAQPEQQAQPQQEQYQQPQQPAYEQPVQQSYEQPQQQYDQSYDQSYQQPQAQQPQAQYQPQYQPQYQQPQQPAQQSYSEPENLGSGDMDGIDTSNIDLSLLDNRNK